MDNMHPSRVSVYYSCPFGLTPTTAQWLLEENFRGPNWGPVQLYWKTLVSHAYPLQWNLFKIMLLIPQIQLFSQCFWLSFKAIFSHLFLAIRYHCYFSLFRPLLHFPWDNFNNLVSLLISQRSRTVVTQNKTLCWKSSSLRKSNMDVDNFNKNVLKYNHRTTFKRLGNIKRGSN